MICRTCSFPVLFMTVLLMSCNPDENIEDTANNNQNTGNLSELERHSCGSMSVHNASLNYGSMIDQEGTEYKTVIINGREWMAENLKTSEFRNGENIPNITSPSAWSELTTPAWCYYNNSEQNECPYGKLYNWYTVNDSRGLCPAGWHVPSDAEWGSLVNHLDPNSNGAQNADIAGAKLKSTGTDYWLDPNSGASNISGFSALPAGDRQTDGDFEDIYSLGGWWTKTQIDGDPVNYYVNYLFHDCIRNEYNDLYLHGKKAGFSVRCIRD